ncbi:MAG: hypothetical protein II776_00770 [Clostridia bacterium]|nr:hypothetical protein [Clostridia bacterium]
MSALRRKERLKAAFGYFLGSLFLLAFGLIYEHFSFGVWSPYMALAFLIPLTAGTIPSLLLAPANKAVPRNAAALYRAAVATLSLGSVLQGVLEIYGTTNRLILFYPASAILLAGAAGIGALAGRKRKA